ncbi:Fanconi anemia core complex-associated protein 100 [Xyrichtys novacula]|uniref:Fanconi anemia core complex-associated protein 100 n=1 Tax=Xyrichtys novacula TaxID=13765 RepID=A0AAV1H430_XYRNO|nr:Fanconi anemia core complex-associated protein 100 [Xyrichtys novacula]
MEGRCAVETWAEFRSSGSTCPQRLVYTHGTDVFLCTGDDEVYVFCSERRKVTTVLKFPGPLNDLYGTNEKTPLYAACSNGVYCVCLQSLLSRPQNLSADASTSPAELQISSESLVVPVEGVLSLLPIGSLLVTLSLRDTFWTLTLYSSSKQSEPFQVLGSFSLPVVSGVSHHETEGKTRMKRRPMLIYVCSGDSTPLSSSPTSLDANGHISHFSLEPVLFKLLFGVDAALAKSPVILCGLPDGRLCFLPLRPLGSGLRVLHSLEQSVIFIGASSFLETSGHAQCLVALGEQGRVVQIKVNKAGPEGGRNTAGFTEGCVPGPVMCSCIDKNYLYYSTGSDLLVLDLSEGSNGRKKDEETCNKMVAALQNPSSLNVCRVNTLVELKNTTGEVQLLSLSVGGQLQRITVPVRKDDGTLSNVPSTQVGKGIRDLLSAIGDVCERASDLKSAIKSKNQILMHLNQVLNISFLLTANSDKHLLVQEKLFRCHAMTSWSRLLQKDFLNLTCVLDNSSPYVLEQGWTLSITVSPLAHSPSAGRERSSTNFSFPFQNLLPGETLEVSLPLTAAADTSFPITVSCSIIFSLSSLLEEEAAKLHGLQSRCISLPLNTLTVDWLQALQVDCSKPTSQFDNTNNAIQAFIDSRRIRCSRRGEVGGESTPKSEPEKYSATVRVSSELLKETLLLKNCDSDPHPNVCLSLLDWLLSEQHEGVKRGQQGDKTAVSNSVIYARGPNGHTIKLTATEGNLKVENTGKEESLTTVEVQIESSSLAAVCGLHHAVLHRVQTLLLTAPDRAASTKSVQSLALRRTLQQAEHLLQQIQQHRISEGFSVGVSRGQMTGPLLRVYRELRENPLLIV